MEFKPEKKYIAELLGKEGIRFVIPEYQRPYRWGKDECLTLWEDIKNIFESEEKEEYFLGSIVAFHNESNNTFEIIDGQQRLTTFTLLIRAFYESFKQEMGEKKGYVNGFGSCVWDYDSVDEILNFDKQHLTSKVATDDSLKVLENILSSSLNKKDIENNKSLYAKNYIFFEQKINELKQKGALSGFQDFCKMFLGRKLFVLFIVCDSRDSAMTIFNTLNSRGIPLSNADILKGEIYKNKAKIGVEEASVFADEWKELEKMIENSKGEVESLDFIFTQFMYVIRAIENDFDTTTPSALNFFIKKDKKNYGGAKEWLLKPETMPFIYYLTNFWIYPDEYLSENAMKYFDILNQFQNISWKSFVSTLVWKAFNEANISYERWQEEWDDETKVIFSKDFEKYLPKLVRHITLAFLNNVTETKLLQDIIFKFNANILNGKNEPLTDKYNMPSLEAFSENFWRINTKKAKYLLLLHAYVYSDFYARINCKKLDLEHILPKEWQNANFDGWNRELHDEYLEQIGNKMLLEKRLNIKCANHFFAKKQEKYKESQFQEANDLGNRTKNIWLKEDIEARNKEIYQRLKAFFEANL